MGENILFLLLSYALTPTLSQRERELSYKHWAHSREVIITSTGIDYEDFSPRQPQSYQAKTHPSQTIRAQFHFVSLGRHPTHRGRLAGGNRLRLLCEQPGK